MKYALNEMNIRIIILLSITILILSNCAPRVTLGPVYLIYPEIRPVEIELRSFSFYPDHIAIIETQSPFAFRLTNTGDIKHNFTLIDNHKKVILSVDIMQKESAAIAIESIKPGNYIFYCNRFLHRRGGMEGMLMVTE